MSYKIQKFVRIFIVKSRHLYCIKKKEIFIVFQSVSPQQKHFPLEAVSTNRRIKRVGELDILSDTLSRGQVRRYRGKEGWVLLQGWVCTCCGQQRRRQEARQRQQRMTSQVKECPLVAFLLRIFYSFLDFRKLINGFWYCNLRVLTFLIKS